MNPFITLLTDFGLRDPYVGIMKAVMIDRAPDARIVDLTHEVTPQNVRQGAFALASAVPYCPKGAIHVAVVDPGVGTRRRAVVVQSGRARYVAPDNGLLTLALQVDPPHAAWHLTRPQYFLPDPSATFHGRDVFAPVAAHLAQGAAPDDMGEPVDPAELVRFDVPLPAVADGCVRATVLYVDRFGNLVTNVSLADAAGGVVGARVADRDVPMARVYRDVPDGSPLVLWGSTGRLEVSVSMGSAAAVLGVGEGAEIAVRVGGETLP